MCESSGWVVAGNGWLRPARSGLGKSHRTQTGEAMHATGTSKVDPQLSGCHTTRREFSVTHNCDKAYSSRSVAD